MSFVADSDELHDLSADPEHGPQLASLKQKLEAWLKENGDPLFDSR